MNEFTTLLQQGNAWILIPSAILLGALHGLEPGHSKTMMAAFIVAVRGSVLQAVLLGLAATISHTAVVWLVAMGGLYFGQNWSAENTEPVFQLISAAIIAGIALWMMWRIAHPHEHSHDHHEHAHQPQQVSGNMLFTPQASGPLLQRTASHGSCCGDHAHAHVHNHSHDHSHSHSHNHADDHSADYQDAHARMHAEQIEKRFANRQVTTGQIVLFGLTGGLIPCPASITVLLICLQLKEIALGATLVLCFSIGLALTLVTAGVVASLGLKHLDAKGFNSFSRKVPYFSSGLMLLVAVYMAWHGWRGLAALA